MNNETKYTTIAASSLSAMLNKIAGLAIASDADDVDYYMSLSHTAIMLANEIKYLEQNNIPHIPYMDASEEPCDGDCENCELNC